MNSNNFSSIQTTIHVDKKLLQKADNFRKDIFYLKADISLADSIFKKRLNKKNLITNKVIKEILTKVFFKDNALIESISDSTLHSVYRITFLKEKYILKINNFSDIYPEAQFLQEVRINNLLKENALPFLSIIYVDISRKDFPFDFIIMKEAEGSIVHNRKLDKKKEEAIFSKLGEFIAKIHSLKTTHYGPFSTAKMDKEGTLVGLYTSWEKFFLLHLDSHIDICANVKAISLFEKDQINQIFSGNRYLLSDVVPAIIHNDLSARNMFTDSKDLTTLIDWEDAISGDPIYDIASFGTFCYMPQHEDRITYFKKGYKSVRPLPLDFEKRYWLYYLRIALLKTALLSRQSDRIIKDERSQRIQKAMKELLWKG